MATYVWRDGKWVDKETESKPLLTAKQRRSKKIACPMIISDLPAYVSPVTGKLIEGRKARREDLARSGCREVDPTEFKPIYRNYEFCQKRRLPYMGADVPPPMSKDERVAARERRAAEKAAEKAADAVRAAEAAKKTDPDLAKFTRGSVKGKPIFNLPKQARH